MPTYRCFCMTAEHRIITGARLSAPNVAALSMVVAARWDSVPGFHHVEIWLGPDRLSQETAPAGDPPSADPVPCEIKPVRRSQPKLDRGRALIDSRAAAYLSGLAVELCSRHRPYKQSCAAGRLGDDGSSGGGSGSVLSWTVTVGDAFADCSQCASRLGSSLCDRGLGDDRSLASEVSFYLLRADFP
jgi:hypothetical protein